MNVKGTPLFRIAFMLRGGIFPSVKNLNLINGFNVDTL